MLGRTATFVCGSICETVPSRLFVTHTKPPPIATPAGPLPTVIVCLTVSVAGSRWERELPSAFAIHTALPSAAIAPGDVSTAASAMRLPELDANTPTESAATPAEASLEPEWPPTKTRPAVAAPTAPRHTAATTV